MENQSNNDKTIAVIGLGYVGLPLALLSERKGYKVVGLDINEEKITSLIKREPLADEAISNQLKDSTMELTTDFKKTKDADIIIICVPTPVYDNHIPNLEPVESACRNVGRGSLNGQLVILESTVNPGVCENIVIPILEKESGLTAGKDFFVAHCPERINPGDKNWTVENIPRVVGGLEEKSLEMAYEFYSSIISGQIKKMGSLKEAEAVKVVENSFRDINIAFVNELAMSFSKLGIDVVNVINGAATKPFAFMAHYPGVGVGGHCIPVDPYYLIDYAKQNGFEHDFLKLARKINSNMPKFTAEMVVLGLNEVKIAINGVKVAVLGLAYKPNIDDCRESPAFDLIKALEKYGANVASYDPFVLNKSTAKSLDEAVKDSAAVVIATCHNQFKNLEPEYLLKNDVKVVVDGRNCLQKEQFVRAGIIYKGVGR